MSAASRRTPPWWAVIVIALYVLTQGVNSWQEVFGPGSAGLLPDETGFTLVEVAPGLPMDVAGVRVGDTIEQVDGIPIAGMPDWFLARANFRRNIDIPFRYRRGDETLTSAFLIRSTNWDQWSLLTAAFQVTRWLVLALAAALVWQRPRRAAAWWLAWLLCSVAVTEGNPSAGWLSGLRDLPAVFAIAVAMTTASWLFIPVLWIAFCGTFARRAPGRPAALAVSVGFLVLFGFFVVLSAIAMIGRVPALAMPTPFDDVGATRTAAALFSVTPQLFLNPWPGYTPVRQSLLLGGWLALSGVLIAWGVWWIAATYRALAPGVERRRVAALLGSIGCMAFVGVHNALARNWQIFGREPPIWLGDVSVALEAVVFAVAASLVAYAVVRADVRR